LNFRMKKNNEKNRVKQERRMDGFKDENKGGSHRWATGNHANKNLGRG